VEYTEDLGTCASGCRIFKTWLQTTTSEAGFAQWLSTRGQFAAPSLDLIVPAECVMPSSHGVLDQWCWVPEGPGPGAKAENFSVQFVECCAEPAAAES